MKLKLILLLFAMNSLLLSASDSIYQKDIRIISLAPSQTEMLFHLGFGEQIVGVTDYCNFPKDALYKQKIGSLDLNIERIMSLKPTVLIDINHLNSKYQPMFKQLGINYVNFNVSEVNHLPTMARELCVLLNSQDSADNFCEEWNKGISELALLPKGEEKKIYIEIWDTPMQGAGGASFLGKLLTLAGGKNILETEGEYPVINHETIIEKNPDFIILSYPSPSIDSLKKRPGWGNIKAVKNNRVFCVDQDLFVRPGPRNLEGLKVLVKILFPNL